LKKGGGLSVPPEKNTKVATTPAPGKKGSENIVENGIIISDSRSMERDRA
jgi:hypothetical protein